MHETAAAGAERGADSHLPSAAVGPRQQQVGDVDARDQQHERDRTKEDQQRRADPAYDPILQTDRGHRAVLVGARIIAGEAIGDGRHRCLRLIQRHPISQSGDAPDPLRAARIVGDVARLEDERPPECRPGGDVQIGRRDTDDGEGLAVEPQGRSDDVGPRTELPAPQPIAEYDHLGAAALAVGVDQSAAQPRHHAEHVEERRRDVGAVDQLRIAGTGQVH